MTGGGRDHGRTRGAPYETGRFGLLVEDMAGMIRFYRDVLGFGIKEAADSSDV